MKLKRYIITLILTLALLIPASVYAQKFVIGSKIPEVKNEKNIDWVDSAADISKIWVVDFYSPKNPSAEKFYNENVDRVQKDFGTKAQIVIIIKKDNPDFRDLAKKDGSKFFFAINEDGKIFEALSIKYIPYTVVIDEKNRLLWQGNLSTLTTDVISKIISDKR